VGVLKNKKFQGVSISFFKMATIIIFIIFNDLPIGYCGSIFKNFASIFTLGNIFKAREFQKEARFSFALLLELCFKVIILHLFAMFET
jgi:hypothetical protein